MKQDSSGAALGSDDVHERLAPQERQQVTLPPHAPRPSAMTRREVASAPSRFAGLPVSAPGDADEREADELAERAATGQHVGPASGVGTRLQRCPGGCGPVPCRHENDAERLQRKATGLLPTADRSRASVDAVFDSPGQPLETPVRTVFEQHFGHDFAHVRVHTGTDADRAAAHVAAAAFTVAPHVVFAGGRYAPGTAAGARLLAHELAHVVQQDGGTRPRRIQRQPAAAPLHTTVRTSNPPTAGVGREKWGEEIEDQYRRKGDAHRADAVRRCRELGAMACWRLLTAEETHRLYALANSSGGNRGVVEAGLAMAVPALALVRPVAPVPQLRLVPPSAPPPASGAAPSAAALGAAVGIAALVAVCVACAYSLWSLGQFQNELRNGGLVILESPLALCVGGCHLPSREQPSSHASGSFSATPDPDPAVVRDWLAGKDPAPDAVSQERERRRRDCFSKNPGAIACDEPPPTSEAARDEILQQALWNAGRPMTAVWQCQLVRKGIPAGRIDDCDGAPAIEYHCTVRGESGHWSIFGCLCCDCSGQSHYQWSKPHPSVKL
ncbi:DUF4157 domain-containing protein [Streptomyces sp. NPDC059582]|uniref:eCIS core domain-containing protein n=1 Tax=Streptomyces sp. NPDC059582 TaxID=3346875 RepID=UPI0036B3A21A